VGHYDPGALGVVFDDRAATGWVQTAVLQPANRTVRRIVAPSTFCDPLSRGHPQHADELGWW
jgi:hypothetical protein